ncbi:uncharacterized protein Pyn_20543 [Prunus yedoensis var. nudiflora]|uniref:Uncharacterized protein n=1 Tax=Prunus yedoensis var. nudiflora TaxID=2094558 RepID=A0A314ZB83_PRUYE|nr:uncharacterized protein Pyn_20543 [Prunus yedoensis var. nudiflora]
MVAAAASATATRASNLRYSSWSVHRRLRPAKKVTGHTKFATQYPNCFSSTSVKGSLPIRELLTLIKEEEKKKKVQASLTIQALQTLRLLTSQRTSDSAARPLSVSGDFR